MVSGDSRQPGLRLRHGPRNVRALPRGDVVFSHAGVGSSAYPRGQTIQHLVADGFGRSSNEAQTAFRAFDDETEPAERRERLMATYANAFIAKARGSGARPVALFLDDLERIDTPSVDALTVLVSRLDEARILIIGALRSDIVAAELEHPLRLLLERVPPRTTQPIAVGCTPSRRIGDVRNRVPSPWWQRRRTRAIPEAALYRN